jgi:hypothetical protein
MTYDTVFLKPLQMPDASCKAFQIMKVPYLFSQQDWILLRGSVSNSPQSLQIFMLAVSVQQREAQKSMTLHPLYKSQI